MKRNDKGLIELTEPNEIFCFGSNESGIHGAGAAKFALDNYGAQMGYMQGHQGRSYAIPTKDYNINSLSLIDINLYVQDFINDAYFESEKIYVLTPIGCGLAGYKAEQIAPMFIYAPDNVIIPEEFEQIVYSIRNVHGI